ncbi:hypothetical protein M427DRAFT_508235 [Gonapodya prolifera JEL478]|uniref:Uncharacterized protein n=1 Tax=Gonapodya prolifera (strain JEL478) TaxID=1344416 RepID=A0A139A1P5_GONPJ|nr:hypothetical protein M427DRAFT_508235 [Gonapodya prolifera JEL478]|eukprot:KXS10465.1 hypothetical protein M427DRAFT_508235 [Gonapodya prolifera JEL478]
MAFLHPEVPLWRRLWSVGWLLLLVIAVAVANYNYKVDRNVVISGYNTTFAEGLQVSTKFAGIDTTALKVSYRLTVWGLGKYTSLAGITFIAGDTKLVFNGTSQNLGMDVVFTANVDGEIPFFAPHSFFKVLSCPSLVASFQPMDEYSGAFSIFAIEGTLDNPGPFIPIGFLSHSGKGAWNVIQAIVAAGDAPNYAYANGVVIKRSGSTKFISILQGLIQGLATLGYLMITTDIRIRGKKLNVMLISFGISLLFGLPGLNTAPSSVTVLTLVFVGGCVVNNFFRFVYEIEPVELTLLSSQPKSA